MLPQGKTWAPAKLTKNVARILTLHHCPHCHKWIEIVAIVVNGATGSIGAIGSPNDPLTLNGDCELSIAIEWIKWRHLIGANGDRQWRQWRSPLSPRTIVIANGATYRIAIDANGASIGATHCRHWRQMIHSPNFMTLYFYHLKVGWGHHSGPSAALCRHTYIHTYKYWNFQYYFNTFLKKKITKTVLNSLSLMTITI